MLRILRAGLAAHLMIGCASPAAPLPSLQATRGPVQRPCSGCQANERCGDAGVCVTDRLNAREALGPDGVRADNERRVASTERRQDVEKAIYRSRSATIASGSVLGVGVVLVVAGLIGDAMDAAEAGPEPHAVDGTSGLGLVIGGVLAGVGGLGTIVAGTFLGIKTKERRQLAAEQAMTLRVRPQVGVQGGHGRGGLALELRF